MMNSIAIFSLGCLLLTGCSMPEMPDFTPTEFNDNIDLTVVVDNDLGWLGKDTARYKVIGTHRRAGNTCIIWIPMIKTLDDKNWCTIGKEVGHCIWGDFHGNFRDIY